ncbi:MAG: radical SAM protein [Deltaproteobacteria bacterium]|nr:radical SAM protein [Deltaproteobacteria bacterium]
MKVFIKGLNVCPHRRQNLLHFQCFIKATDHELTDNPAESDVILAWTCGFRQDVIDNSISQLVELQKTYSAEVIALGCLPDIDRAQLTEKFSGRVIPWKREGPALEAYFQSQPGTYEKSCPILSEEATCVDAAKYREEHPGKDALFADQFFKLMITQGCPYRCSYCTELLAFPPFKSFPIEDLVSKCQGRVGKPGQNSMILIGDCLGQYGRDIGTSLPELIRALKKAFPTVTFALQNYHPIDLIRQFPEIKSFIQDGWIAHLNLPVQSGSDRILKAMQRQYTRADLDRLFGWLRELEFRRYDTHIIVGFPGETDECFQETVDFLRTNKPTYALVSMYYDAPNAQASKLADKVDQATMLQRLDLIETVLVANGILYNLDGKGIMKDRLERINKTS